MAQTKTKHTPAIPAFSPFMKFHLPVLSRAAPNSLCVSSRPHHITQTRTAHEREPFATQAKWSSVPSTHPCIHCCPSAHQKHGSELWRPILEGDIAREPQKWHLKLELFPPSQLVPWGAYFRKSYHSLLSRRTYHRLLSRVHPGLQSV